MTKDVLVSIVGAHLIEGEDNGVEVITSGSYYFKNGRHYVVYDEMIDGVEGTVKNTIKIGKGMVDVIKNGNARSHMVFEQEKKNVSCYVTPFGQMMVGVNTNNIEVDESEDKLFVKVDYTLDINYEQMSHCQLTMEVRSRLSADLHLGS